MTAVSGKSPLEHRNLSSSPLEGNPSMINPVDLCSGGESGDRLETVDTVQKAIESTQRLLVYHHALQDVNQKV